MLEKGFFRVQLFGILYRALGFGGYSRDRSVFRPMKNRIGKTGRGFRVFGDGQ